MAKANRGLDGTNSVGGPRNNQSDAMLPQRASALAKGDELAIMPLATFSCLAISTATSFFGPSRHFAALRNLVAIGYSGLWPAEAL
jgi:hypothetical protein